MDPRRFAVSVIERVFLTDGYADLVFSGLIEKNPLPTVDRSLAAELTYGTLRWMGRLEWVLQKMYKGPIRRMPQIVQWIAEVGLYQILFLDKIPAYAAVNEAVESAKEAGGSYWGSVVNGLLRNAIRNPDGLAPPSPDQDAVLGISIQESHPEWLVRKWIGQFGVNRTIAICSANNIVSKMALRVNRLKTDRAILQQGLEKEGIPTSVSNWLDDFLISGTSFHPSSSGFFARGWFTVQDESAGLAVKLLDPKPGETILDMAAAPGGKSTAISEWTGDGAHVFSIDRYFHRIGKIRENQKRLGIKNVHPVVGDGARIHVRPVDKTIVDAPCSGIGILRKHPEIKWKRAPSDILSLIEIQKRLLESAAQTVKPGGVLVYSTCTVFPEENGNRILEFLDAHPEFRIEDAKAFVNPALVTQNGWVETWPDIHGMDGSFAVRMKKREVTIVSKTQFPA